MENLNHDLVINFTPTGMVPQRKDTPYVPLSVAEIVEAVHEATEAGVTSVHLHARSETGDPTSSPDTYGEIIRAIRRHAPELVVCVSLSGRVDPSFEARLPPLELEGDAKPDMGSLTLASLNFTRQASVNAPETVKLLAEAMRDRGVVPELEIFDVGMANYANYLIAKGVIESPFYANIIVGNIATAQLDLIHIGAILRDLPAGCVWTLGGLGRTQLAANTLAIATGGGVRVGLEDNIYLDQQRSTLASNTELIRRVQELGRIFGRAPMPPADLRKKLAMQPGYGAYGRPT